MKEELQEALTAIKAEDETRARVILSRLLQRDPENVAAWILLSKMAQTPVQQVAFLRKIVAIDPDNAYANLTLAQLGVEEEPEAVDTEPSGQDATPIAASTAALDEVVEEEEGIVEGKMVEEDTLEVEPESDFHDTAIEEMFELFDQEEAFELFEEESDQVEAEETGVQIYEAEEVVEPAERPSMPISEDPFDYEAQAEGDTLPPWLADEEAVLEPTTVAEIETAEVEAQESTDVPDWLQAQPEEAWMETEPPEKGRVVWQAGEQKESKGGKAASPGERRAGIEKSAKAAAPPGGFNWLAASLIVAIGIVALLLLYMLLMLLL